MKEIKVNEDVSVCDQCNAVIESESDVFDYEDALVCEYCFDELRRLDERMYQNDTEDYD